MFFIHVGIVNEAWCIFQISSVENVQMYSAHFSASGVLIHYVLSRNVQKTLLYEAH